MATRARLQGMGSSTMAERGAYDDWVARDYLGEYYKDVQQDERSTIRYFVEGMRDAEAGPVLCFGCGPTLHHVFLAVPRMTEVYLADYLPQNLEELERWRRQDPSAHDWTPFVRYTLECETGREPTGADIDARTAALRRMIGGLVHADAARADPLGKEFRGRFATVLSPYCAEAATEDKAEWVRYARNIASLVRPGGLFLTAAVRHCRSYKAGERFFPATDIDEDDLGGVMRMDFRPDSVHVEVCEVPDHRNQGFSGTLLARGIKT
jgi:hypothetical protein